MEQQEALIDRIILRKVSLSVAVDLGDAYDL